MMPITKALHDLVIERANLEASRCFSQWPSTPEQRESDRAHNEAIDARILETYAEARAIIVQHLENETK